MSLPRPYYEDSHVTLYCGDGRDIVPHLPVRSVDLVVTDPPFFMPANVQNCRKAWARSLGDVSVMARYFRDALAEEVATLRPTGAFYIFGDAVSYAVFHVVAYPLFDRTQCIVWDKGSGGLGSGWRHAHELILHGAFAETIYSDGFRVDVVGGRRVATRDRWHQSEKPTSVVGSLLDAHPTGLVLDPFVGGGTTLYAARERGWRSIGIDIDERNCAEIARRLAQEVLPLAAPKPRVEPEQQVLIKGDAA